MVYSLIAFLLALIPFVVFDGIGDGIRTPKEIASIIGFILIIGFSRAHLKKPFKNKFLFIFWGWCLLTVFFGEYFIPVHLPKNIIVNMSASIFAWKYLYVITLVVFAIDSIAAYEPEDGYNCFKKLGATLFFINKSIKDHIHTIASAVNWCVIILGTYCILQAFGIDDFFRVASNYTDWIAQTPYEGAFTHRIVATIGNPSILGTWFAMCLPVSLYLRNKLGVLGFILGIIVICMTKSSTAIVGACIAVSFYLYFNYKFIGDLMKVVLIISIFVGSIVMGHYFFLKRVKSENAFYIKCENTLQKLIDKKDGFLDGTNRIAIHKETWKVLLKRPLVGLGFGSFEQLIGLDPVIYEKLNLENWRELHDEFGQIWFATGLVGLVLFLAFIISTYARFLKSVTPESIFLASSLMGFLAMSFTLFPMRVAPTSFYGAIFTGLLLNVTRRTE